MSSSAEPAQEPIFFVHVMKTGGMTLFSYLRQHYGPGEVYPDPELDSFERPDRSLALRPFTIRNLELLSPERRRTIRVYTGHFPLVACEVLGGGFATVTVLRDPVERTISLLRQLQRPATWEGSAPQPLEGLPLEEIYEQPQVFGPLIHDHQTKLFSMTLEDEPRGYMQLIEVDDTRLARAKANLASLDVLGVTERYPAFLDAVERRFGWRVRRDARVNAAPDEVPVQVSDSLRRRIAEDNAIDVELYRHALELVEAGTGGSGPII